MRHAAHLTAPLAILTFVLVLATAPAGSGHTLGAARANSSWRFEALVSPRVLPEASPAPVALVISNRFPGAGGSPHALRTLTVRADRDLDVDVAGMPVCRPGLLESVTNTEAMQACGGALLGRGSEDLELAFPEQAPVDARLKLLLFNGGRKGRLTTLLIHGYTSDPTPAAIIAPIKIGEVRSGRYKTQFLIKIPTIAGGFGAVTAFDLKIKRMVAQGGEGAGVISARCSDHSLDFEAIARFADGSSESQTSSEHCTPKR